MINTSKHVGDNGSKSKVHAMPNSDVDGHKAVCGRKVQWINANAHDYDHEVTCLSCLKIMHAAEIKANTDKFIAESDARLAAAGLRLSPTSPYDHKVYEPPVSDYARRANHLSKYTVVLETIPCEWTHAGDGLTCGSAYPMAVHRLKHDLPVAPAGTALCACHSPYDLRSMTELHTEALQMNSDRYMLALAEKNETITDNRLYHTPLNRWEYHIRGLYVSLSAVPVIDMVLYEVTKSGNPSRTYETWNLEDAIRMYETMISEHMQWLEIDRLDREWHYTH